ncbi:phospholipase, partial [Streptomyces bungoensis]
MASRGRRAATRSLGALATAGLTVLGTGAPGWAAESSGHHGRSSTATPVKHVVVLFDENVSFDHYFAT